MISTHVIGDFKTLYEMKKKLHDNEIKKEFYQRPNKRGKFEKKNLKGKCF